MNTLQRFANGLFVGSTLLLAGAPGAIQASVYQQENLVSNVVGLATFTDPNLRNPWGLSHSATSPTWVSNQGSGNSTLYNTAGQPQALVVTIPASATGPSGPTGQVFNSTNDFLLTNNVKASFLFANLDGSISGWNGGLGTTAQVRVSSQAIYTGLALGNVGAANFLYAADSQGNKIDAFSGTFAPVTLAGSFVDPNLPAGFSVYNIQQVGGLLVATYENETTGGGVVDAFDFNGNFVRRISANGAGGPLESPWGVTLAPASFGQFGGALLVGNEDDGRISAFNFTTGSFLGQLLDSNANPLANTGLWGLVFGNGGNGGNPNKLYFAAGINGERDGLFGAISLVPEPASLLLVLLGGIAAGAGSVRTRRT
jgi:uncharacterized protein (TIGR03118 family)